MAVVERGSGGDRRNRHRCKVDGHRNRVELRRFSVGDAFVRLFQFAGFWWNVVTVPLITLIGFGLSRDAA
jgi:hypothetical protein